MYHFIVNTNSRSGEGMAVWNLLRRQLVLRKVPHQVYLTQYAGHAVLLSRQITGKGTVQTPVYLVAVGGDGTLQEVLTGITDLDHVVFGYIPTGSGNDFCRSMGIPLEPVKALDTVLKRARIQPIDIPCITEGNRVSRFGVSAGIGYDAAICQEVSVSKIKKSLNHLGLGKLVYLLIALKQFLFVSPVPMTVTMDGNRKRTFQKVYFIAVMNQKFEGGGFPFCPCAQATDGILDAAVMEGMSKPRLLFCLAAAIFGRHTHLKGVHILRCKHIRIQSRTPLPVHKDGEARNVEREFFVSLEKKSLKVILPVL